MVSVNLEHMSDTGISMKVGLLEGNMSGHLLTDSTTEYHFEEHLGVVADVAMSLQLWSSGKRFVRYRSLSVQHRYRNPGGYDSVMTKEVRRATEDRAIRALSAKWPLLIRFEKKTSASLGQQQYKLANIGESPLVMRPPAVSGPGRPYVGFAGRPMTPAERQRKVRHGHRALSAR